MGGVRLKSAIGFTIGLFLLLQATSIGNATNSTTGVIKSIKKASIKTTSIKAISKILPNRNTTVVNLNTTDTLEVSKKDKRQAQRGYTDAPLEERPLNDISNTSPISGFARDLTKLADKLDAYPSPSTYLPTQLDNRKTDAGFFSRLGFPSNLPPPPRLDDVSAAAATIQERRDDFFDSNGDGKPIPGEEGRDYPAFTSIPKTSFSCKDQQWPGYYADTEARCQVFWICQKHRMDAFLCPLGTVFNQQVFVCDWWFNVDCSGAPEYYSRNQYLYSGPGVGIDGSPTRFSRPSGNSGIASSLSNSVVSRPIGVNSNSLGNQVQSSNNVAQISAIVPNQSKPQQQQHLQNSFNKNQPQQNYLASSSQQSQQNTPFNHQNQITAQKYSSHQNMLVNRMQKTPTNPTFRPEQRSGENLFTGGYQQPIQNSFNQIPNNDLDRRSFSSDLGGYQGNNSFVASTTRRPSVVSIQTSSRPIPVSQTPNVNIDQKGNQAIVSFTGTISSTARPFGINTEVPSYNHGSSTLQTPKNEENNFRKNLDNGGYQNNHRPSTTDAPITTTFRSTSTTYTSNLGFGFVQPNPHLQPTPNPINVGNRQVGSLGSIPQGYSTTSSTTLAPPLQHNSFQNNNGAYVTPGFLPSSTLSPNSVTAAYGPSHKPTTTQGYVDRFGFVQNNQQQKFVSTTAQPHNFESTESGGGYHGMRSNQYTNQNGQREVMYSPSSINANIEYPYSPSQQKNKQMRIELDSLKSISSQAKEFFAYPHFQGQRSNSFSEGERTRYKSKNNNQSPVIHNQNVFHLSNNAQQQPQTETAYPQPHPHHFNMPNNQSNHQQPHQQVNTNQHQPHPHSNNNQQILHSNPPNQQPIQNNIHQPHPNNNQQVHSLILNNQQQPRPHPPNTQTQNLETTHNPSNNQPPQHFQQHSQNQQPPHPQNLQQKQSPQQPHPQQQQVYPNNNQYNHNQQYFPQLQNNQQHLRNQNQQFSQVNNHQTGPPTQNSHQNANPQSRPHQNGQNYPHQTENPISPQLSPSTAASTPFHERVVQVPSSNLQLPSPSQQSFPDYSPGPRNGYTALKSGSFISVATADSPFSKQILSSKNSESNVKPHFIASGTSVPNRISNSDTFHHKEQRKSNTILTTLRPPSAYSSSVPFTNEIFTFSKNTVDAQPTSFPTQNAFIAAPTQSPISSTSPGHRQNAYLPHNHGKRNKQNNNQQQKQNRQLQSQRIQYPNAISTTIKYPEGTGSLMIGIPGATTTKRIVDFSYTANPTTKTSITKSVSSTTPYPVVKERFNNAIVASTTTRRPKNNPSVYPSYSPKYKEMARISPGARLAGSVVTKSTSSSSAIYVDTSATAESVSTPVSVFPSATAAPAVSTSNFGLRISTTAKKRMANAWQNYFTGSNQTQTVNSQARR